MTEQVELERGKTEGHRVGRRITRSRRWWAVVAVSALITHGLAYEFIHFDHSVVGHMPVLVVAVLPATAAGSWPTRPTVGSGGGNPPPSTSSEHGVSAVRSTEANDKLGGRRLTGPMSSP